MILDEVLCGALNLPRFYQPQPYKVRSQAGEEVYDTPEYIAGKTMYVVPQFLYCLVHGAYEPRTGHITLMVFSDYGVF